MRLWILILMLAATVAVAVEDPFKGVPDRRLPYGMRMEYFPVSIYETRTNAVSPFRNEWYSAHLRRMQEPSLLEATNRNDVTAYRFTYLPTWGRPFAVRCVVTTNQVYLRKVFLSGDGGYDPGFIAVTDETVSSNALPEALSVLIDKTIWNSEFRPKEIRACDGAEWIVEGVRNGQYRLIVLWSPEAYAEDYQQKKAFVDLCRKIVELTGESINKVMGESHGVDMKKDPMRRGDPNN